MAYLVASLIGQQGAHVGPTVFKTATKALQDQLYGKDVPQALDAVADLLGSPVDAFGADPAVLMKDRQKDSNASSASRTFQSAARSWWTGRQAWA